MPSNMEIKAVLRDRAAAEARAAELSTSCPVTMRQEDIFFRCNGARLKLRILGEAEGELIRYQRSNHAQIRSSNYIIARTQDPQALREILSQSLGIVGVVRKTRVLYLAGQTRIHVDEVEGLGNFLELEVVMRPGQTEEEGKQIANELLAKLGIKAQDLVAEAYIDLLPRGSASAPISAE